MSALESPSMDDLLREREWRKCAPAWDSGPEKLLEGFMYFCEKYWYIQHPERGRIKFSLFEAQVETVEMWLADRYTLVLKARQIGFSTLVATYAFWLSFFYNDRPIVMLSRTERDAVKLLRKAKYGQRFLPEWMKWRGPPVSVNQTKMEFANGSYLESLPSASDPARGEAVYLVIVDEIAFLPNPDEAWSAIEPVADVGGRVIMLSTANGWGNLFHKLWVGSQNGTNRFRSLFHPWSAGDRDEAWYESKRRDLPEWQLAQEYPSDPEEAFLKSGRPVFDVDKIRDMHVYPPIGRGRLDATNRDQPVYEEDGGALQVWEFPKSGGRYAIGADVSFGLEHGDYSSAHVINAKTREVVAHWHGQVDPDLFGSEILYPLGVFYNRALVGVESNNHGLTTCKALHRLHYTPLYYQHTLNRRTTTKTEILGWRTTQATKPLAIDELRLALRGDLGMHCEQTQAELLTYVRDDDGKTHGSPWDDRVMSLAIAVQMLKFVWLRQFAPPTAPPPGTFGHMERVLFGELNARHEPARQVRIPIGQNYVRR